jgi:hypothetical protein
MFLRNVGVYRRIYTAPKPGITALGISLSLHIYIYIYNIEDNYFILIVIVGPPLVFEHHIFKVLYGNLSREFIISFLGLY